MNAPATYDLARAEHDYPAWEGPPRRTILVCSHPRSGSTLLGEALTFAGGLGCPLEYFHAGFRPGLQRRWGAPDISSLLAAVVRHRTDPSGTLAVKLFWRDLVDLAEAIGPATLRGLRGAAPATIDAKMYRALAGFLAAIFPKSTFVHLTRRDRVRQAVSGLAAIRTARWRDIPGLPVRDGFAAQAVYDFERIDQLVQLAQVCDAHWGKLFAANGLAPIQLTYEALASDYEAMVVDLLRGLGSIAIPAPPRMRRQGDAGNEALVLRYLREQQVRQAEAAS
jgi:LPS sulfotransferase NodH